MKSDYIIYGILGVALVILAYTLLTLVDGNDPSQKIPQAQNENSKFQAVTSGNTDPGNAQIDLTPKGAENGQLKVDFAINTHSVTLSEYDLTKVTTLEYGGKKINPISAPALEGHHNSGVLTFNVGQDITKFKITIVGIPSVQERVFEWG